MYSSQGKLEFPLDDQFWAVKFIDQFSLAHGRTRTASVQVMLQRLPIRERDELLHRSTDVNKMFLGQRRTDPAPEFEFVSVLAGALPAIHVGDVIYNREKIGELPSSLHTLVLRRGESDSFEARANEPVDPLPGWGSSADCRILNKFEYSGLMHHPGRNVDFGRSRLACFKRVRKDGGTDTYVLPRMTIFKAFYAVHSVLANAFCSAPWAQEVTRAISFNETYGGIKTGIVEDGRQWNVVLQTLIPDDYAGLLAVLHFDDYARARADAIYTQALQDRRANLRAPWFASAQIPLQARTEPLELSVKCMQLHSWRDTTARGQEHRKFIVTDICGSTWPQHYPMIGHARTNDGADGAESHQVPLPAPYRGNPATKDANQDTLIRSDLDAHTNKSTTVVQGSQWSWIGLGPTYQRLEKERSRRYDGGPPIVDVDGTDVSPGAHTSGSDALPKAEVKTVVRPTNALFEIMHSTFLGFEQSGFIRAFCSVPARRPGQQAQRSGVECWTFIDDESLRRQLGPSGGFRTVLDKPYDRRSAHWRTGMILRFDYQGRTHHWLEIECSRSESFRSLLLSIDHQLDANDVLETTLNAIADADGRKLQQAVAQIFRGDPVNVFPYTHNYNDDDSLRVDLLQDFLRRSLVSK